jgi:spermidine synthase
VAEPRLAELDYQQTPMGELVLRRRREPRANDADVWEVLLGEEFLMSSLFTAGEVALAELGLAPLAARRIDVVVGGLGLGYTARAALEHANLQSLLVIDALAPVIRWHRDGLVPMGSSVAEDPRCRLVQGDFFALAAGEHGFDPAAPGRAFDAVLLDIDHSPQHVLAEAHRPFYEPAGLAALRRSLKPGGVFALWSNDPPADDFVQRLGEGFTSATAHVVQFDNPYASGAATNTIYVARTQPQADTRGSVNGAREPEPKRR